MCGIAGYLNFETGDKADISVLKSMTDCIAHRGPDGAGYFVKEQIALGHRRLSIIDVAGGQQPMANSDNSIVLTFNGEIYNYIELREELKKLGHTFNTSSDTEVIIRAYEEWGIHCQAKFNGMWAFALWDQKNQELFLSRDRIGEKPLHYFTDENRIVFGSELKSLKSFGVPFKINEEVIELYLFLTNIPTPFTFYKNVYKLRPGHFLKIKNKRVEEIQYWDLPEIDENNMQGNEAQVLETFEALLLDSVKIRMRSDVPFGAFLSGGLDSSSIVAAMAGLSKQPLQTFTIGFEDKFFNESELAELVAEKFGTMHHLSTVKPTQFKEALSKVKLHFDEPFGDSSAIPTGYVSGLAAEKVKVVLTGDGGDEVLSGYNSYLGLKIVHALRSLPPVIKNNLPALLTQLAKLTTNKSRYRLNKMAGVSRTALLPFEERMIHKMGYTSYENIKDLVAGKNTIRIEDFISDFYAKYKVKDDFYKMMFFDFKHHLPDDYLAKVDRMSMASSLEARTPFLDFRLIEFMCGVDKKIKLQGWKTKSVLRKTLALKLPEALLSAPKKGFGIPVREWFKSESFRDDFRELAGMAFLDRDVVQKIIDENRLGKRDNGNFIWSLFVLNEFMKQQAG